MGLFIATKLPAFGRECIPLFSETMVGLSTGHFLGVYCNFFFFFGQKGRVLVIYIPGLFFDFLFFLVKRESFSCTPGLFFSSFL